MCVKGKSLWETFVFLWKRHKFRKKFWRFLYLVSNEFPELNPFPKISHFSKTHLTEDFIQAFRCLKKWIQLRDQFPKFCQFLGGVRLEPCHIIPSEGGARSMGSYTDFGYLKGVSKADPLIKDKNCYITVYFNGVWILRFRCTESINIIPFQWNKKRAELFLAIRFQ